MLSQGYSLIFQINQQFFIPARLKHDKGDGGIIIDMEMRSIGSDVYAAGDIVSTSQWIDTEHWFQVYILISTVHKILPMITVVLFLFFILQCD